MPARILVACGNGIATSTVVASKIRSFMEDKGLPVDTTQTKLMEVPGKVEGFDLLVTTGEFDGKTHGVPYVKGMPILTGIGADNTFNEIYKIIKEKEG
ncbi:MULTISPECIES: PTS sugar transporter subunit IIB [Companilactobacillus]|uniref:PTS family galactitol porter component IIB n=4 Tax=Companilactobacillus TaxID=2767879 RepID=A0ABR5NUA6_9LACO|nr:MULTISPECIES: PTS sugar transporter subunit IIB [Companilactobacillus]GEO48582.1 PTS sugar transporter subunit IIB [Companilactobacillus paralimentarius]KAE9559772.1 PTS galactitol transporter subunit IIB [Companilactobacillus kimchii]KAE9562474.1 PTS galactitol transporter subunit IIB [Companilactobacillus bobalius]KRK52287.1 PTS family galactitol porter component IIB [Companilactobacillus kimchii DSM 13961 = JCM 10707]KRK81462.1 PTS family galactitol porter component IIB [Companilactobaci